MLKIAINGASGRMGQELQQIIQQNPKLYQLVIAREFSNKYQVHVSDNQYCNTLPDLTDAQVLIDFSSYNQIYETLNWCEKHNIPLVIGTTGFNTEQIALIHAVARKIPIVYSANMSLSVNILFEAVKLVAKKLADFEVEITESHHRYKKDAPSGTALKIGQVIADARGVNFNDVACYNRIGNENKERSQSEIGFSVVRGGDIVGKHVVDFISDGEELTISSVINNRKSFAMGAMTAAKFVVQQDSGLFSMQDVLGLSEK